ILPTQSETFAEIAASDWKPWSPRCIKCISIKDSNNLQLDFLFDSGTESQASDSKQREARLLIDYFLSAVAVDEDYQWAAEDGKMVAELRGTSLGFGL